VENKTYHISTSVKEGIIEIVFTGEVAEYTINSLHDEVIAIIQENDAEAVLSDLRAFKGYDDSFGAAYFRTRSIPEDILKLPAAVVDLTENKVYQSFYETTAANAGQILKWFTDIETARIWLKSRLSKTT